MRDVTDNRTGELAVGEVKRGRGRPRKADSMSNAERQRAYRARLRSNSVTVTKKVAVVSQVDAYDDCRLEVDRLREELAWSDEHRTALLKGNQEAFKQIAALTAKVEKLQALLEDRHVNTVTKSRVTKKTASSASAE
ncbi:DNA-binding protein [Cupriavidus plantarum]|uniref:DNA-binding protein n=1 Tax=Cupriavidus plantarum TaxID=942865 RepID=UPI0015CC0FFD|nr:DNA-binding protein [Cupriavidus plantarum]NYI00236.1 hypothetical protein [Cupriavidus plantarum]